MPGHRDLSIAIRIRSAGSNIGKSGKNKGTGFYSHAYSARVNAPLTTLNDNPVHLPVGEGGLVWGFGFFLAEASSSSIQQKAP